MKYYHLPLFLLAIFFAFLTYKKNFTPPNLDAPFYRDKYGELKMTNLKEIYATNFPQDLRNLLFSYVRLSPNDDHDKKKIKKFAQRIIKDHHHNHPRDAAFYEALEYINIFRDEFFLYEIEKYEDRIFCGAAPSYRMAVFITERLERLQFYIYKNTKNEYEICDVEWEDMTDWKGFENIRSVWYDKYWI